MSSSSFSIPLILAILSCLFNIVCAEFRYYGPTIGGSIGGLIILILDIIAILDVLRSSRSVAGKLLWVLLIVLFPIGGLIIWLLCGRKTTDVV